MKLFILCVLVASGFAVPPSTIPRSRSGQNKIVGGEDARPGQFPYQLGLYDVSGIPNEFLCGAIVYATDTMITAANSILEELVAGNLRLQYDDGTEQSRSVVQIIAHESYNVNTAENDIALLKVDSSLEFNTYVSGVTLPFQGQNFSGNAFVSGWRTLSPGGSTPGNLQYASVPIVDDETCRSFYGASAIADSMICAGDGNETTCKGDGGGPMTCGDYLCGITSFGYECNKFGYPGVKTEVVKSHENSISRDFNNTS
ncbi:trypsin-1-like [Hyalella azteca]|uniref:Trypsin-1-like n=1 Tax=Hyalella azteca TaxID=294128 RepID=A0A8B7NA81_HYAAZ|nr:trypsin-1-like [Hyalella azteca]